MKIAAAGADAGARWGVNACIDSVPGQPASTKSTQKDDLHTVVVEHIGLAPSGLQ
ncbi:MAG TPA: hypothetical protein VEK07_05345 [Polyangiaceae bacterium]|nr:hypothetical protein [Polyangiaceae bacterium]